MDQQFISQLLSKNLSSMCSQEQPLTHDSTDLIQTEEAFREQIELKFNHSDTNHHYVFPRIAYPSSRDSSYSSLRNVTHYNLYQTKKPLHNPANPYKASSTENNHNKPTIHNKRLKTEGNEKYDRNDSHFRIDSDSDDFQKIEKCKTIQNIGSSKIKSNNPKFNKTDNYHSILSNLQQSLYLANMKEYDKDKKKQSKGKNPDKKSHLELLLGSKKNLKTNSKSNVRNKTTHSYYDEYHVNSKSINNKSSVHQSYFNTFGTTQNSKSRQKEEKSSFDQTPIETKSSSIQKSIVDSKQLFSKAYLKPNSNKILQNKIRKNQKNIPNTSLNQEFLLHILISNQAKQSQTQKIQTVNNSLQNPIFNVSNSNINLNLNISNEGKQKQFAKTLAMAEYLKNKGNDENNNTHNYHYQTKEQEKRKPKRCQTDPAEVSKSGKLENFLNSRYLQINKEVSNKNKKSESYKSYYKGQYNPEKRCNTVMGSYENSKGGSYVQKHQKEVKMQGYAQHLNKKTNVQSKYKGLNIDI